MKEAVIVSAVRTPLGSFNGTLANVGATQLGALVIEEAIKRAGTPRKRSMKRSWEWYCPVVMVRIPQSRLPSKRICPGRQNVSPSIRYVARA